MKLMRNAFRVAFSMRDYEFISQRAYWRPTLLLTMAGLLNVSIFIALSVSQHGTDVPRGPGPNDSGWEVLVFWAIALALGLRQMMLAEVRLKTAGVEFPNMGRLFVAVGLLIFPVVLIASLTLGDSVEYRRYVAMRRERAARAAPTPPRTSQPSPPPPSAAIPGLLGERETRW